ncbi:MAG: methionyl-tRNA formyltransferase [Thermoguttaceae bacterium]
MRLLMLGTGPFAVPTFQALLETHHTMAALVTGPLRTHRGRPVAPISSIRAVAQRHAVPIVDPEDVNAPESRARLAEFGADLLVVCDYGRILSPAALGVACRGGVNLHASLLPKYRGAAPIAWALWNGDTTTGVTVIHITPELDAGPCIAQQAVPIGPDETAAQLEPRLAELGARLVCETIDRMESGRIESLLQDPTLASRAPKLKKSDGLVDWTRDAEALRNQVRALDPWPKTYTYWRSPGGEPVRLILGPLAVVELPGSNVPPGTVVEALGRRLVIAAGRGGVMPQSVQPAGKRAMSAEEFLRGHRVRPGDMFFDLS